MEKPQSPWSLLGRLTVSAASFIVGVWPAYGGIEACAWPRLGPARHGAYGAIAALPAGGLSIDDQIPDVPPDVRRRLPCSAVDRRSHHVALLGQDVTEKGVELGCRFDQEQGGRPGARRPRVTDARHLLPPPPAS